jgi:hypothetical protein
MLKEDYHAARDWLRRKYSREFVCSTLGCSMDELNKLGKGTCGYIPTPAEIDKRAAKVRSKWPANEAAKRIFGGMIPPVEIAEVSSSDIVLD